MKIFDLSGRRALITGSTRGIGLALAGGLGRAGASIVLNGRDAAALAAAAAALSGQGIAATGKSYAIRLHEFHTFEGSQIAYTWHMEDWFGFLNQIGAWPVTSEGDEQ